MVHSPKSCCCWEDPLEEEDDWSWSPSLSSPAPTIIWELEVPEPPTVSTMAQTLALSYEDLSRFDAERNEEEENFERGRKFGR